MPRTEPAKELWFVTGSQSLYGPRALEQVARNARAVAAGLNGAADRPAAVVFKGVAASPEEVLAVCREAGAHPACVGVVAWMHTFSPAKMWIAGLQALSKPLAHLHTQFHRDIPWAELDMEYMNLHQSAHGDREFGFLCTRLGLPRKVIVGHWQDPDVAAELAGWARAAIAWDEGRRARFARFGDNMREVAVTEGNKVAAQAAFGWSVNGYGVDGLAARIRAVPDPQAESLAGEYLGLYTPGPGSDRRDSLVEAARIEIGLRGFLEEGGFQGFTTTFEDLGGIRQLPGLTVQRLMAEGYGFGAEGDWKTAALLRAVKVMGAGRPGGASFMEDYTYHFDPAGMRVLGAHMLEVCPSIAGGRPSLEVHPLEIGGREDPARLVFHAAPGPARNASLIELEGRFRLVINEVEVLGPEHPLPRLPVAHALWRPKPDMKTALAAWIRAGGAHHTVFTQAVSTAELLDYAAMAGMETVVIA